MLVQFGLHCRLRNVHRYDPLLIFPVLDCCVVNLCVVNSGFHPLAALPDKDKDKDKNDKGKDDGKGKGKGKSQDWEGPRTDKDLLARLRRASARN